MDFDETLKKVIFLIPIIVILSIFSLIFSISGKTDGYIECIAVDSSERLYIGKSEIIEIWESNTLVGTIDPQTSRGYLFSITPEDTIILSTSTIVYSMELDGTIINSQEDVGSEIYYQLQKTRFSVETANGDSYILKERWMRTKIVKNSEDTVYQISTVSFLSRIVTYILDLSIVGVVIALVGAKLSEKFQT